MRFLKALALICGLVAPAAAGQYFTTPVTSTTTGTAWSSQSGQFYFAASSANVSTTTALIPTKSTFTITLDGTTGNVWANLFTAVIGFVGNLTGNVTGNVTGNLTGTASLSTLATTATNVAAGALGSILYQSASSVSAWLAAGTAGQILQANGAAAPSWTSGLSNNVAVSTANFSVTGLNGASQLVQLTAAGFYPALNGSLIVGIAGTVSGGFAGGTTRWTGAASLSTGAFTDNGNTVTAPSGTAMSMSQGSTFSAFGKVRVSSGATVNFAQTLAFSMGQASYNASASVTGSTISFTVQGTTVACWLQGSVGASIQSGTYVFAPIVDGGFIKNESASVGATSCQSGTGTATCNPSFYREFQVTGGGTSHTFTLGAWAPSGTGTFPGNFSDAQFGCREVPSQ